MSVPRRSDFEVPANIKKKHSPYACLWEEINDIEEYEMQNVREDVLEN